jgi:hypothetical protein
MRARYIPGLRVQANKMLGDGAIGFHDHPASAPASGARLNWQESSAHRA